MLNKETDKLVETEEEARELGKKMAEDTIKKCVPHWAKCAEAIRSACDNCEQRIRKAVEAERLDRPELRREVKRLVLPLSKMRAISMTKDMSADRELVADNIANELTDQILVHCPDEKEIRRAVAEEIRFEILEWFRNYARQLDRKHPNPTVEEQGWLGTIWDMIRMAGKEEWKSSGTPSGIRSD